ncbi:UDP-N-acetylmuramoyl-tripeptide--D-alanyl-D-alanine ligase [Nitratiruptor sp. YY08-26]|uniref:Mur ligase family protein n=1 Tax=unclassified Nitratiruptor TaxID=2624044 RepID=UPI0019155F32|nr:MULTISPECIES: UDP-N-acetylmuramoyl-tripeptide--D-alanyl-D-alanine ligase [unclassified Nitratiruptor]BCD62468.1 UDP-N-acetylmuramoyl-tripeptide--D-alanyl-D-alanine ligase [Nitratiruptor sp. YY08-13]BCD66404.1 UDP-N-acetylmuramoyl-tripeptide--D-alanyl-D-alanine ligase [Nitratiruptor sp. YY08-26]
MSWIHLFGHILFVLLLGYYLITNLQWYNYKLSRILLHHHAPYQHILFFLLPLFGYLALREWVLALDLICGVALYFWQRKLDKKLVFTSRVKRFFMLLLLFTLVLDMLFMIKGIKLYSTLLPLALTLLVSNIIEKYLFMIFYKEAKKKLKKIDPIIVAITASYGKTSIKNFLTQILQDNYRVYKTPRSVNTLAGIMKDINESLPEDTQIYIVEAGARERGDIASIAKLVEHQYAIIGKIGEQHIEYFQSLENIILTKLEILLSKRLKKAFIWDGLKIKDDEKFVKYGKNIKNIQADLEGVSWDVELDGKEYHFYAPVLGGFNALNITAAILAAHEIGLDIATIQERVRHLKPVEHRLQKIEAGGKLIIDDSFNGNLEGMVSSYELVKGYPGRKVIVTPGIVESTPQANEKLARKINEVFDLVIITGKLNREILDKAITKKKVLLDDKQMLQNVLAESTKAGDLILFSNDTPAFM